MLKNHLDSTEGLVNFSNMKKKIVIFGCQKLAIDIINFLKTKCDIVLVITYELPNDKIYGYDSVQATCQKLKIPLIYDTLNENIFNQIQKINPDIIFSIYYRKILPSYFTRFFRGKIWNFHPSFLPKYRGPVPTAWAMLNNESTSGLTIHEITSKVDGGDIIFQKKIKIPKNMTGFEFHRHCMDLFFVFFKKIYKKIFLKIYKKKKQSSKGTYYGKIADVGIINWQSKAVDLINLVRVYAKPYNMVMHTFRNRTLFINRVSMFSKKKIFSSPGTIINFKNNKLYVQCADAVLRLDEYYFYPPLSNKEKKLFFIKGKSIS